MKAQRLAVAAAVVLSVAGCVNGGQPYDAVSPVSSADLAVPAPPTVARLQRPDGEHVPINATAATTLFPTSKIRAVVNGSPILDEELREATIGQLRALEARPDADKKIEQARILAGALDQLIERELIYTEMEKRLAKKPEIMKKLQEYADKEFERQLRSMKSRSNIKSDEEFKAVMEQQGMTQSNLKRQIQRSFMVNEFMRNMIFTNVLDKLGLNEIRQYYDEHPGEFLVQDRVRWQDIFIDAGKFPDRAAARAEAERIVTLARSSENFASLVSQYDQGTSKMLPNGEGIGQERGQIRPPELEQYLFQMKPGEVGPIVEMPFGYHVFKLVEREYAGRQPFNGKTQDEIMKKVKGLLADREYKRLVDDMKRRATIQKFLDN